MPEYLTIEQIIKLNRRILELSAFERDQHDVEHPSFLLRFDAFPREFTDDFDIALAYCIVVFTYHVFREANHRTSQHASELFLLVNGYRSHLVDLDYPTTQYTEERKMIYKWRIDYEDRTSLEPHCVSIELLKDYEKEKMRMIALMNSEYGITIKEWLKRYYSKPD